MKTVLFLCTGNYFRSRFAELLFDHLAAARGLPFRAGSAGLAHDCHARNAGPISQHTLAALARQGIAVPIRPPRDVTAEDFTGAAVIIALKEAEHRPMIEARFPEWAARVRYWHVDDIPLVPADRALAQIEPLVRDLVEELAASSPVPNLSRT